MEAQRIQLFLVALDLFRLVGERAVDVEGVSSEQPRGHNVIGPVPGQEAGQDRDGINPEEVVEVTADDLGVKLHLRAGRAPVGEVKDSQAGDGESRGREQERRAQYGPDADLVGVLVADHEDGDDRDHRLRERGTDRGQDAANGAGGKAEAVAEPLDGVREKLGGKEDDDQREGDERYRKGQFTSLSQKAGPLWASIEAVGGRTKEGAGPPSGILGIEMYYPQEPKEPSGCMQTLIITRVILGMLAVPVGIIAGALFALLVTLYMFTVSPPLALIPVGIGVLSVIGLARWEKARIARQTPPEDR